ncbi:MAG: hypothetical protein GQ474_05990 [Sulfurimonas sp.]|nr:hypothetical protein [Sulfurimonas sp.]
MSVPMEVTKNFIIAEKGAGNVLASSSAYIVIKGFEHLTFMTKTFSLAVIKNGIIEYSTPTGNKTFGKAKNQTYNTIPISFNEREGMDVKDAIECIQTSGHNGELEVEFFIGDGEHVASKSWGKAIAGFIVVEDNPEADSEGSETALSHSVTLHCHYFPNKPTINESLKGIAYKAIEKLNAVDGTYKDC